MVFDIHYDEGVGGHPYWVTVSDYGEASEAIGRLGTGDTGG